MEDVEKDNILNVLDVDHFPVDFELDQLAKRYLRGREEVSSPHLGINDFVAELREEELRILLSHIVKLLTDSGI